jgi:hybrid polyketide synthase/nonribosomal peptide synthetase ACE1
LPETLSERIGHVAATNADKLAVKDGYGNSYTYAELQHKAQAIATTLTNAGVQPGTRVAVFQQPSSDWVASLLGIWHAGATYIPMDLRSSLGRLADVAASAAPSVILTHDETDAQVVELKTEAKAINISGLEPVTEISKTRAQPKTAAAILFTSGSTGTPKGVIIPHSALRNTIEGLTTQYNLKAERVLQQSAFTFDFSLDQILVGLVNGGSIYVASQEDRLDPLALSRIVSSEKITYTRATPTEYFNWISHGSEDLLKSSEWTFAWAGGETLPHSLRQAFASLHLPGLCLLNSYGPAETITCTKGEVPYLDVDEDDVAEIPVGFPLPNYTVYIVDNTLDIVPQGVSGEIVIGGPSVGGGYLNNERLTDSKFINIAEGSGVVYRTGDVGYLRADGALIFQGRLAGDLQVKIRGMRVDLQDVESCILAASRDVLDKAIVTVREGDLLVAHVQFSPGYSPDESERQAFLRSLRFELPLPVYMLPTVIIPLDSMPTNAHGKTDRAAIQAMPLPQSSQRAGGEALTETEIKLLGIWKDVGLGGESHAAIPVDNQTTFFEMGGNSILLVKLQILISMHFNAKLSLLDLFNAVSLGAMASKIEAAPKSDEIDWEAETKVEEDLVKTEQDLQASVQTPPSTVLVTGATGYLGGRIVQALDALSHVKEIHCVATRSGEDKLKQLSGKVIIHGGNLAAPRLGLSEETFHSLSESADLIIHAGVSRSVLDSYQSLRGANVGATKTLVRLAANRRVPVHYISTGTLSTLGDAPPPSGGSLGYVASKWASERYLSNAARELDLPVTVHRIVPAPDTEGESTADTAALEEVLAHIKQVSTTLGVAPTFFGLDDWSIDLIRTNRVVNAILSAKNSTSSTSTPSEHVSLVEHTCDVQLKCGSELETQAAKKNSGEEATVEKIAFPRWLARARKAGLEWQIGSLDNFPLEE